jgi:hypothetical protein
MKLSVWRQRWLLASALCLASSIFLLDTAYSQVGRPPGNPAGGFGGQAGGPRPGAAFGNQAGAIGNRPGAAFGNQPGAIGNQPGVAIGNRPGMAIGNPGGFGIQEKTWICPKCKRVVGTGPNPPVIAQCCGVQFVNGKSIGVNFPSRAGGGATGSGNNNTDSTGSNTSTPGAKFATVAIIVGVGLATLFVLGGVTLFLVLNSQKNTSKPKRKIRRDNDWQDEEDDRSDERPRRRASRN